jgi:hypothetical protein
MEPRRSIYGVNMKEVALMARWCATILLTLLASCNEGACIADEFAVMEGVQLNRIRHGDDFHYWLTRVVEGRQTGVGLIPQSNDLTGVLSWLCIDRDSSVVYGEVQEAFGRDGTYYFIIDDAMHYVYPSEQLMRTDLQHLRLYESEMITPKEWLRGRRPEA